MKFICYKIVSGKLVQGKGDFYRLNLINISTNESRVLNFVGKIPVDKLVYVPENYLEIR
jgi:hypothetical protein